jgi:hypothetical protein
MLGVAEILSGVAAMLGVAEILSGVTVILAGVTMTLVVAAAPASGRNTAVSGLTGVVVQQLVPTVAVAVFSAVLAALVVLAVGAVAVVVMTGAAKTRERYLCSND